jgi:hypothetical protein
VLINDAASAGRIVACPVDWTAIGRPWLAANRTASLTSPTDVTPTTARGACRTAAL